MKTVFVSIQQLIFQPFHNLLKQKSNKFLSPTHLPGISTLPTYLNLPTLNIDAQMGPGGPGGGRGLRRGGNF